MSAFVTWSLTGSIQKTNGVAAAAGGGGIESIVVDGDPRIEMVSDSASLGSNISADGALNADRGFTPPCKGLKSFWLPREADISVLYFVILYKEYGV